MKTTIGKSLDEVRKLQRNRLSSEVLLSDVKYHKKFVQNTGRKHITNKKRNEVINAINDMIMQTVIQGQYNVRIPGLGIMTILKLKLRKPIYHNRHLKDQLFPKVHLYFQAYGEETRTMLYDLEFYPSRKYKQDLKKLAPKYLDSIKETL